MATSSGLTVSLLLPAQFTDLQTAVEGEIKRDPSLNSAPGFVAGMVADKAGQAARGLLSMDPVELMAQAWAKARELHAYRDETKHPPGETSTVFLGEHSLTCDLHPVIDVTLAALGKLTLEFTLEFAADIRAAELTIRDKAIVAVGRTDASVSAVLKYKDTPLHDPLESKKLTLVQSVSLKAPGVAIV